MIYIPAHLRQYARGRLFATREMDALAIAYGYSGVLEHLEAKARKAREKEETETGIRQLLVGDAVEVKRLGVLHVERFNRLTFKTWESAFIIPWRDLIRPRGVRKMLFHVVRPTTDCRLWWDAQHYPVVTYSGVDHYDKYSDIPFVDREPAA